MRKVKIKVFAFFILITSIIFYGCYAKEEVNIKKDKNTNGTDDCKLNIEDIKKNYSEDEKILNIVKINEDYILVESQRETYSNKFVLYNLKTGDRDIMPTGIEFVKLEKVENENHIVFLSSGINSECVFRKFPYYIRCIRVKNDIESTNDFIAIEEDKYFKINETISAGSKNCCRLSDIVVTLDGLQVLFEPIPGQEALFYAADTDIPETIIYYDEDKKQMLIEMKDTQIGNSLKGTKEISTEKNGYINSLRIAEKEKNIQLIVNIEDFAEEYIAKIKKIDGLPFFEIRFISKR